MQSLKIVVCHHKEAPMLQQYLDHPELYVHIHGGRAASNDRSPFLMSMQGDDTGDNISRFNAQVNEYSVMYWAWKHYDEIGNSDYIGLNHYRRAFTQSDIDVALNYEASFYENIIGRPNAIGNTLFEHFSANHPSLATRTIGFLQCNQQLQHLAKCMLSSKCLFPKNMFIMRKVRFFEMMTFLDAIVFKMLKSEQFNAPREIGFVSERITSLCFESLLHMNADCHLIPIPESYI